MAAEFCFKWPNDRCCIQFTTRFISPSRNFVTGQFIHLLWKDHFIHKSNFELRLPRFIRFVPKNKLTINSICSHRDVTAIVIFIFRGNNCKLRVSQSIQQCGVIMTSHYTIVSIRLHLDVKNHEYIVLSKFGGGNIVGFNALPCPRKHKIARSE